MVHCLPFCNERKNLPQMQTVINNYPYLLLWILFDLLFFNQFCVENDLCHNCRAFFNGEVTMKKMKIYTALLGLLMATVVNALSLEPVSSSLSTQETLCEFSLVTLDDKQGATLKLFPQADSVDVARLQPNQYLCVVKHDLVTDDNDWVLVKKIPLLNGKKEDKMSFPDGTEMVYGDYPAEELSKQPKGSPCQSIMLNSVDKESQTESIEFHANGTCITGWLERSKIRYWTD